MPGENPFLRHLSVGFIYALASVGFLYFSYKYYVPEYGGIDYYNYYNIYLHPLNINAGDEPFVYRQLNALLVHGIWKSGLYYDTKISFVTKGYDQRVFFAAVLANWSALVACATVVAATTRRWIGKGGEAWPLLAGALCFFDFFAQQGVLAGLSEGVSWLLVAVGFFGWTRRSLPLVATIVALSVFQRETIPIVFGALSAFTFMLRPRSFHFHAGVLLASIAAFLAYAALRLWWAPAQGNMQQLDVARFLELLGQWDRIATREVLFQVFLSQNLLIGLAVVSIVLRFAERRLDPIEDLPPTAALYFVSLALTVLGVGVLSQTNSLGRVLAILTPIATPLLARSLARLYGSAGAPLPEP
jgi:hypothetical protein